MVIEQLLHNPPMQQQIENLAQTLGEQLQATGKRVATVESCTGGGVAKAITEAAGSSGWFEMGLVTYSNSAKQQLVGVQATTLEQFGAVSEQVVTEMAAGALNVSGAELAVAVSGIAGPGGGTEQKPVGTVWFGWASSSGERVSRMECFEGGRREIRQQAVVAALKGLLTLEK